MPRETPSLDPHPEERLPNVKTELFIVRHGETNGNVGGLLHGRTDLPLTTAGWAQARSLASRIAQYEEIAAVYTSPLCRARQTASVIAGRVSSPIETDERLVEFDFGELEGASFDELQIRYPELYLSIIDPAGYELSFPNGESRKQLHERVVEALDHVIGDARGERVVVVAHLIVIGSALAHLTSGDPDDVIQYLVRNGSLTHVTLDRSGSAELRMFDDVSHLVETGSGGD
jgi:broad specificity phosphatase PhoE